ncbi:MAG: CDP-glycerol glycerophosphotransferase family protein [Propionibacteriaceae bacterium]|nr:CDP-glycerol glycerophosphotransferase family protein [Propionibacteriaceae bacterium]
MNSKEETQDSLPPRLKVITTGIIIAKALANAVYALLKLLPVQNKVVFITWNSNDVTPDFQTLIAQLTILKRPPKVVALCRELGSGIGAYLLYGFHMLVQMYAMATAKVVVLDAYCVTASILNHRRDLRLVQIWHALGAFKKFGWSVVDKSEGWAAQSRIPPRTLSHLLRMHHGYTAAAVSYSGAIPFYAEAFNADPSIFHVAWLPRVEQLRDKERMAALRTAILRAHPQLAGGNVVLYAPTIRLVDADDSRVVSLVDAIGASGWKLVAKIHPVRGQESVPIFPDQCVQVDDFSAIQMLAIADAVITDYSAIAYEAYICGLPVYFYAHDMDAYEEARGFYTAPVRFPSTFYESPQDLVSDMTARSFDPSAIADFVEIFLEDSDNREDILALITPGS